MKEKDLDFKRYNRDVIIDNSDLCVVDLSQLQLFVLIYYQEP